VKKFSKSESKGRGYSTTKCTFAEKAYVSTEWRGGSFYDDYMYYSYLEFTD